VLEHGEDFMGCNDAGSTAAAKKADLSSRRAALLEAAMAATIKHPHVVRTYDYRVV
jgi:alkylhydroperoxidase family enzyme